jgi:hypothetical protein
MARRLALLIATSAFEDPTYKQLSAPRADVSSLHAVLADTAIGNYEVKTLSDQPSHVLSEAIEEFFSEAERGDHLLLYFSGHGVKDDAGRLYLIATNSRATRLASTTISAGFVREQMDQTRSRQVVVILDCCYAGAFPSTVMHRADGEVDVLHRLGGRGSAVMTSSTELEYAYEADGRESSMVSGSASPSVFTGALVSGIQGGEADLNKDGFIDVNELYEYTYNKVRAETSRQNPQLRSELEGVIYIAKSPGNFKLLGIPEDIVRAVHIGSRDDQLDAIARLAELAGSKDHIDAEAAREALRELTTTANAQVRSAAAGWLWQLGLLWGGGGSDSVLPRGETTVEKRNSTDALTLQSGDKTRAALANPVVRYYRLRREDAGWYERFEWSGYKRRFGWGSRFREIFALGRFEDVEGSGVGGGLRVMRLLPAVALFVLGYLSKFYLWPKKFDPILLVITAGAVLVVLCLQLSLIWELGLRTRYWADMYRRGRRGLYWAGRPVLIVTIGLACFPIGYFQLYGLLFSAIAICIAVWTVDVHYGDMAIKIVAIVAATSLFLGLGLNFGLHVWAVI